MAEGLSPAVEGSKRVPSRPVPSGRIVTQIVTHRAASMIRPFWLTILAGGVLLRSYGA